MKPIFLIFLIAAMNPLLLAQQTDRISGTYSDAGMSTLLQIKLVGDEYHGMVQETSGAYAFRANKNDSQLVGYVFSQGVRAPFKADISNNKLRFNAGGQSVDYIKRYASHQLAQLDLSPYFQYTRTIEAPKSPKPSREESTNQGNLRGMAAEVAGGRLVYYTSSSIFSPGTASSMTFMHFCSDGKFYSTTDASFSIEGDYGGSAHGSSRGNQHGKWSVFQKGGQSLILLQYSNGTREVSVLNEQRLRQGRWKQGNTQYAFERGKAACK